jgi:hypothetical protein
MESCNQKNVAKTSNPQPPCMLITVEEMLEVVFPHQCVTKQHTESLGANKKGPPYKSPET